MTARVLARKETAALKAAVRVAVPVVAATIVALVGLAVLKSLLRPDQKRR